MPANSRWDLIRRLRVKHTLKGNFSNEFLSINFMLYNMNIFLVPSVEELKILQAKNK